MYTIGIIEYYLNKFMILYKTINFRDQDTITKQLLKLSQIDNAECNRAKNLNKDLFRVMVPGLADQFDEMGLELDVIKNFITPAHGNLPIHQDGTDEYPKEFAINWPLENCKNTYMRWWKFNNDPEILMSIPEPTFYTVLNFYKKTNGIEIGCCELLEPTLVDVKTYHSVDNDLDTNRNIISFRFTQEPYFLLQ